MASTFVKYIIPEWRTLATMIVVGAILLGYAVLVALSIGPAYDALGDIGMAVYLLGVLAGIYAIYMGVAHVMRKRR